MNATGYTDFVVDFDRDAKTYICEQTTRDVDHSPLPARLVFADHAAFIRHRDHDGGVRVAFADAKRIVHGRTLAHIALHPVGIHAADDVVVLTRSVLYSDLDDVIRDFKARQKRA